MIPYEIEHISYTVSLKNPLVNWSNLTNRWSPGSYLADRLADHLVDHLADPLFVDNLAKMKANVCTNSYQHCTKIDRCVNRRHLNDDLARNVYLGSDTLIQALPRISVNSESTP
jgi:hypothetical protein